MKRKELKTGDIFCHSYDPCAYVVTTGLNCLEINNGERIRHTVADSQVFLLDLNEALSRYNLTEIPEWIYKYKPELEFEWEYCNV